MPVSAALNQLEAPLKPLKRFNTDYLDLVNHFPHLIESTYFHSKGKADEYVASHESIQKLGYQFIGHVEGSNGTIEEQKVDVPGSLFYNEEKKTLVLAIRGSANDEDWETNFDSKPISWEKNDGHERELQKLNIPHGVQIHRGFLASSANMVDPMNLALERFCAVHDCSEIQLMVTGHSKGSAIGTALLIFQRKLWMERFGLKQPQGYFYSTPVLFNKEKSLDDIYQNIDKNEIVHQMVMGDIVPHFPFSQIVHKAKRFIPRRWAQKLNIVEDYGSDLTPGILVFDEPERLFKKFGSEVRHKFWSYMRWGVKEKVSKRFSSSFWRNPKHRNRKRELGAWKRLTEQVVITPFYSIFGLLHYGLPLDSDHTPSGEKKYHARGHVNYGPEYSARAAVLTEEEINYGIDKGTRFKRRNPLLRFLSVLKSVTNSAYYILKP